MVTQAERLGRAIQLHQAGQLEEAESLYRGLLEDAPEQPETLHALGLLLHQKGDQTAAVDFLRRSLAAAGPRPGILGNLGAVCLAAGHVADAATYCQEAVRIAPGLAMAQYNLGAALFRLGQLEEAELALREAVRLMPGDIVARCTLGNTLQLLGKQTEALALLQETSRMAPADPRVHHDLGAGLLAAGQSEAAAEHLREAVRLKPDFVEALDNLGLALRQLDQLDEAIESYHAAVRLAPAYIRGHINLGNAFESQGNVERALAAFEEARRHDPFNAQAIFGLSKLVAAGRFEFEQSDLAAIARKADQPNLLSEEHYFLHFALAAVFDRSRDYGRAFEHYRQGNEIRLQMERRRGVDFDADAHDRFVDRIISVFTPAYFERIRSFGSSSKLPIFVVGMMRSGTTLAEQILASHAHVHGAGELPDMENLIAKLSKQQGAAVRFPEVMEHLNADTSKAAASDYETSLRRHGGEACRVVDKLPRNFLHLGVIATLFPEASVVHCVRDPIDTCLSIFMQNFGGSFPYAWSLHHMGRYYRAYQRLMAHWAQVLPAPIFELNYERLIDKQHATSRELVAFCGLDWDERCLSFHQTDRAVRTPSAMQVRKPLYRNAIGRWRNYEAYLQPLFEGIAGR